MSASDAMTSTMTPVLRPYLPATQNFADRQGFAARFPRALPRRARCLGAADRRLRHAQRRGGARRRRPVERALARRQPALADRRHAARHQGHHRDRRHADRERLAAVRGLSQRARRRERRRAARGRRRDPRQDRHHRVRRDRAARHPQSVGPRPHARRVEQRLGGGGRRRRHPGRARHPGDRLDTASGELLRLLRLQADDRRNQPRRQLRRTEPERPRDARRKPRGGVAGRLRDREARAAATPAFPVSTARRIRRSRSSRANSRFSKPTAGRTRRPVRGRPSRKRCPA